MIDSNQQKFWMWFKENQFDIPEQKMRWDDDLNVLRLRSAREITSFSEDREEAQNAANQSPVTFDRFGTWAIVNETKNIIIAGGVFDEPQEIFKLPEGETVVDMTMNDDGILYVISNNDTGTAFIHLVNRLIAKEAEVDQNQKSLQPEEGDHPDRIVSLPQGGALVLDREGKKFWQIVGKPLRRQPKAVYKPDTPRPSEDFPPLQKLISREDLQLPQDRDVIAMASNPNGEVALLMFPLEQNKPAEIILLKDDILSKAVPLKGAIAPFSIGWVNDQQWAVLFEYGGIFFKSKFKNEDLVANLINKNLIINVDDDHVRFADSFNDESRLKRWLKRMEVDNNDADTTVTIWKQIYTNKGEAIVYSIPFVENTPEETGKPEQAVIPMGHRYPLNPGHKVVPNNFIKNGFFDSDFSDWKDSSSGDASISWNPAGHLELNDTATADGIADQQLSELDITKEYCLGYEVIELGAHGVSVWVGTTQGRHNLFRPSGKNIGLGFHKIFFKTSISNPWIRLNATGGQTNKTSGIGNIFVIEKEYINKNFCNALSQPVHYPSSDSEGRFMVRPLHPLSYPAYPTSAFSDSKDIIDSGQPGTAWHRIYLEAHIPKGTGVKIYLAADDDKDKLNDPSRTDDRPMDSDEELNAAVWMENQFGEVKRKPDVPKGSWLKEASEAPFYPGLLYCEPKPQTVGLFTALVQRPGYSVRTLSGRYLKIRVELIGNGHTTPEVAAVRVYGPRFSYLDQYLPEVYRETRFRNEADVRAPATGADFLQRYLCLFEGLLTPLEDKVAAAHMLTNPQSAPADALDWLGQWVNLNLEADLPEDKKRRFIQEATRLYRMHGTMNGLALALDLATDDWVQRGQIVLLEDFRLRRTFASILGADLSVENDPLMMGEIPSANSFVGDTLILGEETKQEFLALFSREFIEAEGATEDVNQFYDRLANRLTILVHQHTSEENLALIRRIASLEVPSHIEFRIVAASQPLLVGLYSLVGFDTYLQPEPPRRFARLGHSYLGRYDFIKKLPVLDDRLEP